MRIFCCFPRSSSKGKTPYQKFDDIRNSKSECTHVPLARNYRQRQVNSARRVEKKATNEKITLLPKKDARTDRAPLINIQKLAQITRQTLCRHLERNNQLYAKIAIGVSILLAFSVALAFLNPFFFIAVGGFACLDGCVLYLFWKERPFFPADRLLARDLQNLEALEEELMTPESSPNLCEALRNLELRNNLHLLSPFQKEKYLTILKS